MIMTYKNKLLISQPLFYTYHARHSHETWKLLMRTIQMKPVWGLFWVKEQRPLETVPIGPESGSPLTHWLMHPLLVLLLYFFRGTTTQIGFIWTTIAHATIILYLTCRLKAPLIHISDWWTFQCSINTENLKLWHTWEEWKVKHQNKQKVLII